MKAMDILQILLYLVLLIALAASLGHYMFRVYNRERTRLDRVLIPLEQLIYRLTGVEAEKEMGWREYAAALLVFNFLGLVLLFLLQLGQGYLPFNPQHFKAVKPDLAFNTAVSFMTNTNWQAYSGETTMSYLIQMAGLTVQNFVSAATGMAVAIALIRGLARRTSSTIGNFWADLTRSVLWILLPISVVGALILVSQGVIQNLSPYLTVSTLKGAGQTIALGPVASQEIIKELGTNGGGFFQANSAHPFENPTPLTNLLEMLAILIIPAGLTFTFGKMVNDARQGRVVLTAMLILFVIFLAVCYTSEMAGNPPVSALGVSGPSMEGKEVRFGVANSVLWATVTTAASCGAVNTMHDSLTPLGGLVPLLQIMLGEVIFGGVGAGLYGILVFVILTVFIVGLMVGRTPEYLGKKIESAETKMATLAVLIPAATILLGSALAVSVKAGVSSILNPGPHGLSEILYAFSSGAGNNGSAFAGLNANTFFYNLAIGLTMLIGRFGVILPVLAIAGNMAGKKAVLPGTGTFQTTGVLFAALLAGTVLIVGALTFFPALALGPVVEHLLMLYGKAF
ncbi:MAG: potassium-transporting ATPase subunit KdpA [Peptococcaceae bacterium]